MKPVALVLLTVVIAVTLASCGEPDSGAESTPTPNYAVIALDRETPTPDGTADAADSESAPDPEPSMPPPASTATIPTVSTEVVEPDRADLIESTAAPTAPAPERGEVSAGFLALALLTVADMPPGGEWTSEVVEHAAGDQSVVCGVSDPTDSPAYYDASEGVLLAESTSLFFIQEMLTAYDTPEAAHQVLLGFQKYMEVLGSCDDPGQFAGASAGDLERLQNMEISPIDLPAVGDDRLGYRIVFNSQVPEPQPALRTDLIAVRVDHVLIIIGSGSWGEEQPPLDEGLIVRAVEKVELALTEPPVQSASEEPATATPNAVLDVTSITTCEQAAGALVDQFQIALDILAPLTPSDLSPDEAPPGIDEIGKDVAAIETRAHDLGCADSDFGALVVSRMDTLVISSPTAQLFADLFRAEYLNYEYEAKHQEEG